MGRNVLPIHMVDVQADHTVTSTPGKWQEWTCTLNATYTVARDSAADWTDARDEFFRLAKTGCTTRWPS